MANTAIQIEHLSKYYKLGVINNGTFFRDMQSWIARKTGKPDPHAKIGREYFSDNQEGFWALKDLNFSIQKGDRVGIIGKNGAGKSTLLKILSRITAPTEGIIKIKGKIASLLEVGTGFHAELTGRENIYLNGAILGLKRREVTRKLDEIIAFSEIAKHIDTPVKRYSSGMFVRLAFAVAAHLDSDILIADEVLAVGDAEFQKKALGKMNDLSTGEGRTVLFVSHNMTAVKSLCETGVLLENGNIQAIGTIDEVFDKYLSVETANGIENNYWQFDDAPGREKIKVKSAYIQYEGDHLTVKTPFDIITEFWCLEEGFPVMVSMELYDINGFCIFNIATKNIPLTKGWHKATFHIPAHLMNDGIYYVNNIFVSSATSYFYHEHALSFEITEDREASGWHGKWMGAVRPNFIEREYY
ncbi:hypothetical protein FACS189445_3580 [Spirochaetia bacterium]|nr:hypothetical protein FACS189445_3580 [Spirochaetia bacterium]